MKNYLISLKEKLKDNTINNKEKSIFEDISRNLNVEFIMSSDLKKISSKSRNIFDIGNKNVIYFYPQNDGMPTCPFKFYKNEKFIIDNRKSYSQITNLDNIILQLVRVFDKALDNNIVLDSYCFMLRLDGEVSENYYGGATLMITKNAIRNQELDRKTFEEAKKFYINHFLDHFICWNFGVLIEKNEAIRKELNALNDKVIDMGIREYAGPGLEVSGNCDYSLRQTKSTQEKQTLVLKRSNY